MEETPPADSRDDASGALEGRDEGGPSNATAKHSALEHKLPLSRVKRLIKAESDVSQLTAEAGALITKATELFLERLATQAARHMVDESRVTLRYKDVSSSVKEDESLQFLSDIAPEQISAGQVLSGQETGGSDEESTDTEEDGTADHMKHDERS